MKKICLIAILFSPCVLSNNIKKYSGYLGQLVNALNYAKKIHQGFDLPNLDEITLGYNLLYQASSFRSGVGDNKDIVRTPIEKIADLGLLAIKSGSLVIGYALPSTYAAYFLSGASASISGFPFIHEFFSASLPALKASYNLDEFKNPKKEQQTYLACSYTDSNNSSNSFKIWALKEHIGTKTDLEKDLTFYKNTVQLKGRWILAKNDEEQSYYVFGTTMDPVLVQAACIEALAHYAHENKIKLSTEGKVTISAGNSRISNSYPIRFYYPVFIKAPNWSKFKPVIQQKALLLMEKSH
jgi:hypothetical protein